MINPMTLSHAGSMLAMYGKRTEGGWFVEIAIIIISIVMVLVGATIYAIAAGWLNKAVSKTRLWNDLMGETQESSGCPRTASQEASKGSTGGLWNDLMGRTQRPSVSTQAADHKTPTKPAIGLWNSLMKCTPEQDKDLGTLGREDTIEE